MLHGLFSNCCLILLIERERIDSVVEFILNLKQIRFQPGCPIGLFFINHQVLEYMIRRNCVNVMYTFHQEQECVFIKNHTVSSFFIRSNYFSLKCQCFKNSKA
jgi:hypothetical protein